MINHLQDCAKDYREIDRVYIPGDWMAEFGTGVEDLSRPTSTPGLRRTLDRAVAATRPLVEQAARLPGGVKDRGLRAESAVIVSLAGRLLDRLDHEDPLAKRVKLGPAAIAMAAASGLMRSFLGARA